jgi:hypothetical protein
MGNNNPCILDARFTIGGHAGYGWRCSYPHKELVDFTEISASKYTRMFLTGSLHYLLSICVEFHSCFKKFSMIPIVNYKSLLVNTFLTAQTFRVG